MKFSTQRFKSKRLALIAGLVFAMSACGSDNDPALTPELTATSTPTNVAPEVTSSAVVTAEEGQAYSYTLTATDADGDALTRAATNAPSWLSFEAATGVLSGTPTSADVGDNAVTLTVSDGTHTQTQSFVITVTAAPVVNTPPVITSTALTMGAVGTSYSYTLDGTDADGDVLLFSSVTLPTWGEFDTTTGILSGTPDAADTYPVELTLSDGTDSVTDSFSIVVTDTSAPALIVFENVALPEWAAWDCCGGTTATVEPDDAEHDQVTQFVISGGTVVGFTARDADGAVGGQPFDAASIAAAGTFSFEFKMTQLPTGGQVNWLLKIESDGAGSFAEVDLSSSQEGHASPVLDTWQTYTFNLADLATDGLNLSAIDLFMVFPAFGPGDGAAFRIDNVKVFDSGNSSTPPPPPATAPTIVALTVFEDAALPEWAAWDCCGGTTALLVADDEEHNNVTEFTISGGTVVGFTARDADGAVGGQPFDASALSTTGTLQFDVKMTQLPTGGQVNWLLKVESDGAGSFAEVDLSSSQEGHASPALDTWQTYTFNLADLASDGLNLSAIDLFMVFPAFGPGDGAIFSIDNVRVYEDGAGAGTGPVPGSSTSGGSLVIDVATGINFEGTEDQQASWDAFENGSNPPLEFVANPSVVGNTTATVAKLTLEAAPAASGKFAGAVTRTVQQFELNSSNAIVRIWVYKDKISIVGVKFEKFNGDGYGSHGELTVSNNLINQWEQLTIDFTGEIGRPENDAITGIAIFPDMVDGRTATVAYFDELTFTSN